MSHRRRLERRRRDQREQTRHLRQHLRRRLERRFHLPSESREVERESARTRILAREQLVGIEPVSLLGRHPACRRVGMAEEAARLQLRELVAHRRGRDDQAGPLDEVLRPDRLARGDVLLDDAGENLPLPPCQLMNAVNCHLQEF